jgi:hypothetical protein
MEAAFFGGEAALCQLLPEGVRKLSDPEELREKRWDLLALTRDGCGILEGGTLICGCGTLLLPGDLGALALGRVRAERVIGYGLSSRDSLTLSSLGEQAVLCVQRQLPRPDGGTVEPQEIPLPALELKPEELLAVFGVRLLLT